MHVDCFTQITSYDLKDSLFVMAGKSGRDLYNRANEDFDHDSKHSSMIPAVMVKKSDSQSLHSLLKNRVDLRVRLHISTNPSTADSSVMGSHMYPKVRVLDDTITVQTRFGWGVSLGKYVSIRA